MRRTLFVSLLAAFVVVGCSSAPEVSTQAWPTITLKDGTSLKYPTDWKAFSLEKQDDAKAANDFAEKHPATKKVYEQIATVSNVRVLGLSSDGPGFNLTVVTHPMPGIDIEGLRGKMIEQTRNSSAWIGIPEASLVDVGTKKMIRIRGMMPQIIGEDQISEQYVYPTKDFLYSVTFLFVKSKESVVTPLIRPVVESLTVKQ